MFCTRCGANNLDTDQFCRSCSSPLVKPGGAPRQGVESGTSQPPYYQPSSGWNQQQPPQDSPPYPGYQRYSPQPGYHNFAMAAHDWRALEAADKVPAGMLGIMIGVLRIHKFVLGYKTEGLIMLLVTLLTCGFGAMIFRPIELEEGIMFLLKIDEEFVKTYIQNKRS